METTMTKLPRAGRPPRVTAQEDGSLTVKVNGFEYRYRQVDRGDSRYLRSINGDDEYARTIITRYLDN